MIWMSNRGIGIGIGKRICRGIHRDIGVDMRTSWGLHIDTLETCGTLNTNYSILKIDGTEKSYMLHKIFFQI